MSTVAKQQQDWETRTLLPVILNEVKDDREKGARYGKFSSLFA
jgi:hypothetical protein